MLSHLNPKPILSKMPSLYIKGNILRKEDRGFEKALMDTLFNKLDPKRRPFCIITPHNVADIIATIRYAKSIGKTISVCSGGQSWSANHIRENNILINMGGFNHFQINKENLTAQVEPGVEGGMFLNALMNQNLFFPTGHCKHTKLGGHLLQGGLGWNSRKFGIACENVTGLDIVTANGELVHANASQNTDLFWAARGAGGSFCGIVVCFHLRLFTKPLYSGAITQAYDMKHLEEVYRWAYEVGPQVPAAAELQLLMSRRVLKFLGAGIEASVPIFADSKEELEEAKAFMLQSPIKKKAFLSTPFVPYQVTTMCRFRAIHYPENHHWCVDNMWTSATIDELLPYLKGISKALPPAPSHMLWRNWHPSNRRADMAFSVEDKIYLGLYGAWKSPLQTRKSCTWATDWMRWMSHLSSGIHLADENLRNRPARFMLDTHLQKLNQIRAVRDSSQVFSTWPTCPYSSYDPRVLYP